MVDGTEQTDWVTDFGDEGERYAYPLEINSPGFFEDFVVIKETWFTTYLQGESGNIDAWTEIGDFSCDYQIK